MTRRIWRGLWCCCVVMPEGLWLVLISRLMVNHLRAGVDYWGLTCCTGGYTIFWVHYTYAAKEILLRAFWKDALTKWPWTGCPINTHAWIISPFKHESNSDMRSNQRATLTPSNLACARTLRSWQCCQSWEPETTLSQALRTFDYLSGSTVSILHPLDIFTIALQRSDHTKYDPQTHKISASCALQNHTSSFTSIRQFLLILQDNCLKTTFFPNRRPEFDSMESPASAVDQVKGSRNSYTKVLFYKT